MELKDLKTQTSEQLKNFLRLKQQELLGLKLKIHGKEVKNIHSLREVKKTIARVHTLLNMNPSKG